MHAPFETSGSLRLGVLREIALALSGELDRRRLFEGIVQGARRLLTAPIACYLSWDEGRKEPVLELAAGRQGLSASELPGCVQAAFHDLATVASDAATRESSVGASLASPLLHKGKPLGVIFVAREHGQAEPFTGEDRRLLEVLAGHVTLALVNAETMSTAVRRLARAEELASSLQAVAEGRDRETIVQRTLDCVTTILGADRAGVCLLDAQQDVFFIAGRRLSRRYLETVAKQYRRSVGGTLLVTHTPIYVADVTTDPRTRVFHEMSVQEGIRSMLLTPLLYRNELLGILSVFHDMVWSYDADELTPVRQVADQVALALTHASLHQQTTRQLAQLRVLSALGRAVSEPLSVEKRCLGGVQAMVAGGAALRAWVWLGRERLRLVAHAGASGLVYNVALDAALAAVRQGHALTHPTLGSDVLIAAPIAASDGALGALVIAPLRPTRGEARPATLLLQIGEDREPEARYEFATAAARQLATAIANASLLEEATAMGTRLAAVISSIPDGIMVMDREFQVIVQNRKLLEYYGLADRDTTGWTREDFVRECMACHADPELGRHLIETMRQVTNTTHKVEFELSRPQRRIIERISAPVHTPSGEWVGLLILYHDITELRDAQRTRAEA